MSPDKQQKDNIFAEEMQPKDFIFDDKVTSVFDDMVNRSIPGYRTILAMIGVMAERYYQPGTEIYDLGCSLGGASYAIADQLTEQDYKIQAIDNSDAMVKQLNQRLKQDQNQNIICRCEDVLDSRIENASIVILNFTLQFIPGEFRQQLIEKIYRGLVPGGILVISEKIIAPDPQLNELLIDLYHGFKESMGYSKLEISQKRTALENVLIPELLEAHRQRFASSGFQASEVWFQCFNFASMIAYK